MKTEQIDNLDMFKQLADVWSRSKVKQCDILNIKHVELSLQYHPK